MNITIIYASETGTAEGLARDAADKLNAKGFSTEVVDADDITVDQIAEAGTVLIFASTWGDGEPPTNSEALYEALKETTTDLSGVKYAVFALGLDSYDLFCQAGKDFDEYLARQGAERLAPVQLTNDDHDDIFPDWIETIAAKLS